MSESFPFLSDFLKLLLKQSHQSQGRQNDTLIMGPVCAKYTK